MVVFLSIRRVKTPPKVSMPKESGVTSRRRTSFTSPRKTPPCMAAPKATTSSGFTPRCGSFPKNFCTVSITFGIRVMPPTKITSSILSGARPASLRAALQGPMVRVIRSSTKLSSFARVNLMFKCFGPEASAVINGRFTSVCRELESSIFAFSAASFSR